MSISAAALLALAATLILCDLFVSSRFYVMTFGVDSRPFFMAGALAIVAVFVVLACLERDLTALLIALGILGFFVVYLFVFAAKAGRDPNWNALAQTHGMLSFIVFYELGKRQLLHRLMRIMLTMSALYLAIYCVVASLHYADIIDIPEPPGVFTILHDRERGQRLFLAGAFATFVFAYALARLGGRFSGGLVVLAALALLAFGLAFSRMFLLVNVLVFATYLVTRNLRVTCIAAFTAYLVICLYLMWGVIDPSFEPLALSQTDTTILYRKHEYDVMAALVRLQPIFGIGLYDSELGLTGYVGRELFFPSDIGIIGVWLMFGIVGVVLAGLIPVWICCFPRVARPTGDREAGDLAAADHRTLALTGCVIGLYASTSMNMINGPDSLLFSLILANWLLARRRGSVPFRGA